MLGGGRFAVLSHFANELGRRVAVPDEFRDGVEFLENIVLLAEEFFERRLGAVCGDFFRVGEDLHLFAEIFDQFRKFFDQVMQFLFDGWCLAKKVLIYTSKFTTFREGACSML